MNLQEQILKHMGAEMSSSIEFDIMVNVMREAGWHLIELDRYTDNYHAIDIREWVEANCTGEHCNHGATWLFEQQSDAVLFKLRWS